LVQVDLITSAHPSGTICQDIFQFPLGKLVRQVEFDFGLFLNRDLLAALKILRADGQIRVN
jgi:hypothetical protein